MPDISSIRVPADFESEFPGASRSAAEVAANLAQASMGLVAQIERPPREAHGLSASAFQTLAILDGAREPLPGHTLPESDREHLLTSLTAIQAQLNLTTREPLPSAKPRRRPAPLVTREGTIS